MMGFTTTSIRSTTDVLPVSIIAVEPGSVNGFCPSLETTGVGAGPVERGDRVHGNRRTHANQCSAGVGVAAIGTNGEAAPARVVSGGVPQKWKQARTEAERVGRDDVFCAVAALDRAVVEGNPDGVGGGRDLLSGPMDGAGDQCGDPRLCHSGGVESGGSA